ncbi:MAG: pseudouridylate synthase, small subunit [Chitinophagaceae bacterium]|nr:pseudouridylate synthase, small subunit [Chitinophagaceae bacterium]
MVSQFTSSHQVRLLGELDFHFPVQTHAIGRLDNDSEGLLILTTDKKITRLMYSGATHHHRSYLVLVKNKVSAETLERLQNGISIPVKDGHPYIAKPVSVEIVQSAKEIYAYATDPRESYPHTWLLITLTEGKFRQVKKMVMAVNHRCLRLIRVSIGNLTLDNMQPGEIKELDEKTLFERVGLDHKQNDNR